MKLKYHLLIVFLSILIISLVTGCDALPNGILPSQDEDTIQASGVVEANQVVIAPEVGGQIVEVWAKKGSRVKQGDPLFQVKDE